MGPQLKKILRDLYTQRARTILVVLSIAVGIAAVGMLLQTHIIVSEEMNSSYMAISPANISLTTDPFDDDLIQVIKKLDEVALVEGRRNMMARINVGANEWVNLQLFAIEDFNQMEVNMIRSETGEWPPPKHTLLLERSSIGFIQHDVGDLVLVETSDGTQHEMQIVGTVHDANQPSAMMMGVASGYISFDTLEWLGEPRNFNELYVTLAGNPVEISYIQSVAEIIQNKVEKSNRTVYSTFVPPPGRHPFDEFFQPIAFILDAIGLLALLLSGLLVVNTITALLAQQVREIGVMKAIGARSSQIIGLYFTVVIVFGLLALIIAIPTAILGARLGIVAIASFFNLTVTTYHVPIEVLLIEVFLGLLVPLLAALYPIISGSRITVREAINSYGLPQAKKESFIDRLLHRIQNLPRPVTLSMRNTFRQRGRLVLTLITLILGGAIFIAVFSTRASLQATFNDLFNYWQYDVEIELNRSYRTAQLEREALNISGVEAVESWGKSITRRQRDDGSESDIIELFAPPAETKVIQPTLIDGRWLSATDHNTIVVNTSLLKDEPDIQVGSEITLNIEGRDTDWTVVGVVKGLPFTGAMAYANYAYFSYVTRDVGSANLLQVISASHEAEYQTELARALDSHFKDRGLHIGSITTTADERFRISLQLDFIVAFLLVVSLGLGAVGGIGLMGAMGINVIERRREIGVMRAIGASDKAILQIVIIEGVFVGFMSWLVGTLLAFPLSRILSDGLGIILTETPLDYIFSINGIFIWLFLVTIIAALASFFPARTASRMTIREVIAYE